MMKLFFWNKLLWAGLGIIILAVCIFTFAFMGSTVNPTPNELPLAIVMEDEGVVLPNGEQLNFGEVLVEQIQKNDTSSVNWIILNNQDEAIDKMNEKEVYATLLLPKDLSQSIFSLLTKNPTKPTTKIFINEGMNLTGANVATQITNGVVTNFTSKIQEQLFTLVEEMNTPLSVDLAKLLANPLTIETEKINAVGTKNANGNTPALFTQLLWLTTFISSMVLFTLLKKTTGGKWGFTAIGSQVLSGILFVASISGVILLIAVQVLDVNIPSSGDMFIMMFYIGLCFFFLQNALLNWIGYPAAPLFILLFFFSMPILTLAPEMLPDVTRDWLYSWVPFRYSLENLKDILFFERGIFEDGIGTIGVIGLSSLVIMFLAILKPVKKVEEKEERENQPVSV
ncbi:MAG: YhgE/Pip domain-containing protein [Bacillota bacterium]